MANPLHLYLMINAMRFLFLFLMVSCATLSGHRATAENLPPVAPSVVNDKEKAPDAAFIPAPSDALEPLEPSSSDTKKSDPKKSDVALSGMFGGKGGEDAIEISADNSLEWHDAERVYIASGHARAKKGEVTIEADVLKAYDRKKPDGSSEVWRLVADGNVRVTGRTQKATGQTADYDIDSRKAILKGDNLIFTTATDTVTARDSLEYWEVESRAIAKGNAVGIRADRQVRADELIAQFKKSSGGDMVAQTMSATGHVRITSARETAQCDEAVYQVEPNSATLTGHVFITQGSNQLKGDKVEANFKTGLSKIITTGHGRVHALILTSKGSKDKP